MIRFWVRELLGWVLIFLGLAIFYVCFAMLMRPDARIFEAPTLALIGIVIFRGGIHLLKVAVAARLAMQAPAEAPKPPASEKRQAKTATPWDW